MRLYLSYILAILSGILLFLCMPSYDLWFLAWIGFVPLLFALKNQSPKHQYFMINVACIIWSIGTHLWYPSVLSISGYFIMIAGGFFYGFVFQIGYNMQNRITKWYSIFSIPIAFSVLEWVKTVLPVTKEWWIELLPKSQWTFPENLQILSVTGFIGLSFLIVLTNVIIFELILFKQQRKSKLILLCILLLLPIGNYIYGKIVLSSTETLLSSQPISIGATVDLINQDPSITSLGSNLKGGDGYLADTEEMKKAIFDVNASLSKEIIAEKQVDFIVWGENEFMDLSDDEIYSNLKKLARTLNTSIITDVVWQNENTLYDTALMIDQDGNEIGKTPKIFILSGEEEYGFSPGPRNYPVYETKHGKVALAVCWDRHDPTIIQNYAKNGARLMLIPADDDFEGNQQFPYFAASDAVFRAVENHVAIATGSTSGIAQIVTPYGQINAISGVNKREYIVGDTFITEQKTFYTNYGDVFAYILTILFLILFVQSEINHRRSKALNAQTIKE
ncbi:MAG TPA: nitrilase-related carbon-nitrogen hydrolase [Ureibacillus sp.]|nr:nitrilase-related carbon-nitrogen hydrolase [Ureibacillus sp.]